MCSRLIPGREAKVIAVQSGSALAMTVAVAFRSPAVASTTALPAALFASTAKIVKSPADERLTSIGPVVSTTAKLARSGRRQPSGAKLTDPVARTLCVISVGKNLSTMPVQAGVSAQAPAGRAVSQAPMGEKKCALVLRTASAFAL